MDNLQTYGKCSSYVLVALAVLKKASAAGGAMTGRDEAMWFFIKPEVLPSEAEPLTERYIFGE